MENVQAYLQQAVTDGASDLFIISGSPVCEKLEKRLRMIGTDTLYPQHTKALIHEIYEIAHRPMEHLEENGDDDFSCAVPGLARFRVNTYKQRGSLAAVVRIVAFDLPDWRSLNIPEGVMDLAELNHGMVLVTGTAGSGKSTTQACIIDRINKTREAHVITLEDPIEYLHRNCKSIISQREIAIDTQDYLAALRACLRQAPDVILLGEMRDHETIRTAMTAAEGGLVPAYEIMIMNGAIRSMIRESKTHQIDQAIASGGSEGMVSMDQSILKLYQQGLIEKDTALDYADNPDTLRRRLG